MLSAKIEPLSFAPGDSLVKSLNCRYRWLNSIIDLVEAPNSEEPLLPYQKEGWHMNPTKIQSASTRYLLFKDFEAGKRLRRCTDWDFTFLRCFAGVITWLSDVDVGRGSRSLFETSHDLLPCAEPQGPRNSVQDGEY